MWGLVAGLRSLLAMWVVQWGGTGVVDRPLAFPGAPDLHLRRMSLTKGGHRESRSLLLILHVFQQEIASMDADTTSVADDVSVNRQPEEAVSSTTEDEHPKISAAEGYEQEEDYTGNEGTLEMV